MMGAMLTSYNVVNNSYSQVTDKAKISNQAKVVLGMIMADIRNAGFKYHNDSVKTTNELIPILITKASNFNTACDQIDIVYGDMNYDESRDAFVPDQPFPSWTLNEETCLWEAPVPYKDPEASHPIDFWDEDAYQADTNDPKTAGWTDSE